MARPPQFSRSDDDLPATVADAKAIVKRLDEKGRAHLLAWLCMYYQDTGAMFSPQISRRRQRIAIDRVEYWLVRVPKR
ncbi:MAG: hypothetical protein WCB99_04125 [Candidatus Cybelea sp.]